MGRPSRSGLNARVNRTSFRLASYQFSTVAGPVQTGPRASIEAQGHALGLLEPQSSYPDLGRAKQQASCLNLQGPSVQKGEAGAS